MRGVIDAEKYTRIGLIDTLEPHELKQKHQIAGMVRSVTPKISKAGRKFAILTLEDFTGSIEVLLWSDVYEKTQEMEVAWSRAFSSPCEPTSGRMTVHPPKAWLPRALTHLEAKSANPNPGIRGL